MSRATRSYSNEFKERSIKLALSATSICATAKSLGIPEATLHTWVNKAKKSGNIAVTDVNGTVNNVNVSQVIHENVELKKRVARLEQEKAILKKAAAYSTSDCNNLI